MEKWLISNDLYSRKVALAACGGQIAWEREWLREVYEGLLHHCSQETIVAGTRVESAG